MRIDLRWNGRDAETYEIWRSDAPHGQFSRIAKEYGLRVYSDFLGADGVTRHYRVRSAATQPARRGGSPVHGTFSDTVRATTTTEDTASFLTGVQEAGIRYFFDYAHPVLGLAREWGRTMPSAW